MRYHATYKSLMLLLLLGLVFQFQELQASNDKWYVAEGTTVVGNKHLAQAQKQATTIFVAKDATISGANHFSQKPLRESIDVFLKPNTKLSNWKQVHCVGETLQNTASIAVVKDPSNTTPEEPTPQKATKTTQKNKTPLVRLPHRPGDDPQQPKLVTATATVSFQSQKVSKNVQASLAPHNILNRKAQLSSLQIKTQNQNRARVLQWRSHHTNRPPPFLV